MFIISSAFSSALFWIYALVMFILVLGVIILIHEGGHFIFAKRSKTLVHEFAIGMGPMITSKKKGETVYSIRSIPIGGFCAMAGEDNNETMIAKDAVIKLNFKTVLDKELYLNQENHTEEEVKVVKDIILDQNISGEVKGKVVDYDLYSKDGGAMFITLDIDGKEERFLVARDAFYVFSLKQKIQLAPYDRCMESKTKWQQFLTIFAGPFMNFVLAFFIFLIVGMASGVANTEKSVIGEVTKNYPASHVLKSGDEIIKIDDQEISNWIEFSKYLSLNQGKESVTITVNRKGQALTYDIKTVIVSYRLGITNCTDKHNYLEYNGEGIQIAKVFDDNYSVGKAGLKNGDVILGYYIDDNYIAIESWEQVITFLNSNPKLEKLKIKYLRDGEEHTATPTVWTEKSLSQLGINEESKTAIGVVCDNHFSFVGGLKNAAVLFWNSLTAVITTLIALFSNSQIGINDLSGPVGIFQAVKSYLNTDVITFLSFVGMISANIGLVNLLPLPALDGGRLLFLGVEAVTGKKLNKKVENTIINIVLWMLMLLFVYITIKDVFRLF